MRVVLPSADFNAEDQKMNLIPIALTVVALILDSVFVGFEVGIVSGLIVGLVALQRETHLRFVALQDQVRLLSNPLGMTPEKEPIVDSKIDEPDPDSDDSETHSSRPLSIIANQSSHWLSNPRDNPTSAMKSITDPRLTLITPAPDFSP